MYHAAQAGHTAVCEWLNNQECPWDEHAVHVAGKLSLHTSKHHHITIHNHILAGE
jgi:hypothetical protein